MIRQALHLRASNNPFDVALRESSGCRPMPAPAQLVGSCDAMTALGGRFAGRLKQHEYHALRKMRQERLAFVMSQLSHSRRPRTDVGRFRHVYVLDDWKRRGIG